MHAGQQVLLCWLPLLWAGGNPSVRGKEGELCRAWRYGETSRAGGAFQCPQRHDRAEAKYCCGNCRLPFCCSRGEARLDWRRCRRALPNPAGVTHPQRPTPVATDQPFESWITLVCVVVLLLGVTLCLILSHCKDRQQRRQRALWLRGMLNNRNSFNYEDLFPPPPPPPPGLSFFPDSPPPYAEDPPPYSVEDPHANRPPSPPLPVVYFHSASTENEEDEVTIGPLVHRNVPSHCSEMDSVRDTSVDQ
nr:protein shisa-2 homolog [Pogona vitticeps]